MKGIFGEGPIYRGLTLAHRLRLWGSIEEEEEEEENSFTFFGPKKNVFGFFFVSTGNTAGLPDGIFSNQKSQFG
jgi:hypothetical protein